MGTIAARRFGPIWFDIFAIYKGAEVENVAHSCIESLISFFCVLSLA